ncbi:type II secretion system protein E [Burkholderia ubonensis]|nr:GspE/PulE family protein [Burkholderia ubonensis]KVK98976.1 type II secretion system protein E [Burkholderia ubonensis]KVN83143.1 type II secretion system protein E [Burkholderia ubonensis]KVQ54172.1 type II secretion system protein E [Burkholderia ubonensis]
MMTEDILLKQWQDEAASQAFSLHQYLDASLVADPGRLGVVARCLALTPLDADVLATLKPRFDLLPLADAQTMRAFVAESDDALYLVLADPLARATRSRLHARLATHRPRLAMSVPGAVDARLKEAEASERLVDGMHVDASGDSLAQAVESISLASIAKDQSPIVRLVNVTLYDALQDRASDIHLESTVDGLLIRYRIDGVMQTIRAISGAEIANQTMSRLKVLSSLDIAEKRVPQDGRFKIGMQGREIDFRVSVMPGAHGENAVLRVLDKSQRGDVMTLDTLGFDDDTARRIRTLAGLPYGLTLVTGPTGSGKSTTLYATLSEVNTGDEKLITIEDPVEYELKGVLQIPVNEKKGLTFARGLRSILRHDPDTILVGEIRDEETASIAVQSALTGHRVLSSVHANDAFSVIDRFIYMGVEPSTFLEALNGVVSQRLVRRICPHCSDTPDGAREAGDLEAVQAGAGCDACRQTGYKGRIALCEVLRLDDALKAALLERSPEKRASALAQCSDYLSMRDAGFAAIRQRRTTYQEVRRAVAVD